MMEQIDLLSWKPPSKSEKTISFLDELIAGKKADCPCCGRYAQVYKRQLYHTVVFKMYRLLRLGGTKDFIHVSKLMLQGETGIGDFSKAQYWGLLEKQQNLDEEKKYSGHWKLTEKGKQFLMNEIQISRYAYVFDGNVVGYSDDKIGVQDALDEGFNYQELMKGI